MIVNKSTWIAISTVQVKVPFRHTIAKPFCQHFVHKNKINHNCINDPFLRVLSDRKKQWTIISDRTKFKSLNFWWSLTDSLSFFICFHFFTFWAYVPSHRLFAWQNREGRKERENERERELAWVVCTQSHMFFFLSCTPCSKESLC